MQAPTQHRRVHYNVPQLRSMIVRAHTELFIAGRGTGKTQGVVAPWLSHNARVMKRSLGAIIAPTYKQFLTRFISSIYDGLDMLGYVEGVHYVIGKKGPDRWPVPHKRMKDWTYTIHWCNGSAVALVSQDGVGAGNALSTDYHLLEEAKLLDGDSYIKETAQTKRGNKQHFRDFSEHGSLLVTTDRPVTPKEKWVYRWRDAMDPVVIRKIMDLDVLIQSYRAKITSGGILPSTAGQYLTEIRRMEKAQTLLRKTATYYHEASALENIDAIGVDGLRDLLDTIKDDQIIRSSVLNEELDYVEGGFYPGLDIDRDTYIPKTTSHTLGRDLSDRGIEMSCLDDADVHPDLPLDIALDYGLFSCLGFAQLQGDQFPFLNALKTYHPELVQDLVAKGVRYYAPHRNKTVIYHFDHTAINRDGKSIKTYHNYVVEGFRDAGWNVIENPLGHTPPPQLRYEMWGTQFSAKAAQIKVRFNRLNCSDVITSMRLVKAKQGPNGFTKDKNPERDVRFEQAHAPHMSDMADTMLAGRLKLLSRGSGAPLPALFT